MAEGKIIFQGLSPREGGVDVDRTQKRLLGLLLTVERMLREE